MLLIRRLRVSSGCVNSLYPQWTPPNTRSPPLGSSHTYQHIDPGSKGIPRMHVSVNASFDGCSCGWSCEHFAPGDRRLIPSYDHAVDKIGPALSSNLGNMLNMDGVYPLFIDTHQRLDLFLFEPCGVSQYLQGLLHLSHLLRSGLCPSACLNIEGSHTGSLQKERATFCILGPFLTHTQGVAFLLASLYTQLPRLKKESNQFWVR